MSTNLLGRRDELGQAKHFLVPRTDHRVAVLLIIGTSGIGKTALLDVVCDHAESLGLTVLRADAAEGLADSPYEVVGDLLRSRIHDPPEGWNPSQQDEARRALLGEGGPISAPAARAGIRGLVRALSDQAPAGLLLAVDDAHWADDQSLLALVAIARTTGKGIRLVVAARESNSWSPASRLHEIDQLGDVHRIPLRPLSLMAVQVFLSQVLGRCSSKFIQACYEATEGNPLRLHRLLRRCVEEGITGSSSDEARIPSLAAEGESARLKAMFAQEREAGRLAAALAIAGPTDDVVLLSDLAELDGGQAELAANVLARLEVVDHRSPFRFVHDRIRLAAIETVDAARSRRLHTRTADLLLDRDASPAHVVPHILKGHAKRDPEWVRALIQQAESYRSTHQPARTLECLHCALRCASSASERYEVLHKLGVAERSSDELSEAIAHLREAVELAATPDESAAVAVELAWSLALDGSTEGALRLLQNEERRPGLSPDSQQSLADAGFEIELGHRPLTDARIEQIRVVELPDSADSRRDAHRLYLFARALASSDATAAEVSRAARRVLAGEGHLAPEIGSERITRPVWLQLAAEDFSGARAELDHVEHAFESRGNRAGLCRAYTYRAFVELHDGRVDKAERLARRAVRLAFEDALLQPLIRAVAVLVEARCELGHLYAARKDLAKLETELERASDRHPGFAPQPDRAWVQLARARLNLELGLFEAAEMDASNVADLVRQRRWIGANWAPLLVTAKVGLGQYGQASDVAQEELDAAKRWGAPRRLARALRAVAKSERSVKSRVARLNDALKVLDAVDRGLERAAVLIELGEALSGYGNQKGRATATLTDGRTCAQDCRADRLRAHAEEIIKQRLGVHDGSQARLLALTPRQREVLALMATRKTNHEIAETLGIAHKTVDHHASAIFARLGVQGREQAVAKLRALGS